jgi:hypothetical protein
MSGLLRITHILRGIFFFFAITCTLFLGSCGGGGNGGSSGVGLPATYTVGGTLSGLTGTRLVLEDNDGNNLSLSANGPFVFSTALASGSPYSVTVFSQPTGQSCVVSNGAGTVNNANINTVDVACAAEIVVGVIVVDANSIGPAIINEQLGGNYSSGVDPNMPANQASLFSNLGMKLFREGGDQADIYHWQTNSWGASPCNFGPGSAPPSDGTFGNYESIVAQPDNIEFAIAVNYGSNPPCNGPADPNEAAAWVAFVKQQGYNVKYWTVGNEVSYSSEVDLHSPGAHDPTTYATNVANSFYPLMKAQDANAQIGVWIPPPPDTNWAPIVLTTAKYDFVETHYYPEQPGSENDAYLLTQAPAAYAQLFTNVEQELATADRSGTPIFLAEYNSPNYDPGKQTVSIVNALFIGMVQGEILNAGVMAAVDDVNFNSCYGQGNNSSSLYGWQNFGAYTLISGGFPGFLCPNADTVAAGTVLPAGNAFLLSTQFAIPGNNMLSATVPSSLPNVRAYAAQKGAGYALMLFNLDENNPVTVGVGIANATATNYTGTMSIYDKFIYDQSQNGTWAGPTSQSLGTVSPNFSATLTPWSMNVITLVP